MDRILEGYITEIVFDATKYYSVVEMDFFKGPRGKFLKSLNMWIKMLLYEKWMLRMNADE